MRILRTGFVVLPLLLAACSFPTKPISSSNQSNDETVNSAAATTPQSTLEDKVTSATKSHTDTQQDVAESKSELIAKYKQLQTQAMQNINELEERLGQSLTTEPLNVPNTQDISLLSAKVADLTDYNDQLFQQIVELDQRVESRREKPAKGDMLQIHLADVEVSKQKTFVAQPLVGKWVRGESRIVRLNENFLVENATTEPLNLTFTETYQLIINGKLIGTFGPNRSKYELDFDAPTSDQSGQIDGTMIIRVP